LVDGIDLFNGSTQAYSVGTYGTLSAYYANLESVINSRSGAHGITTYAATDFMQLSRVSTRSDDPALPVYITPAAANTVGIVFGQPPEVPDPVDADFPNAVVDVIDVDDSGGLFNLDHLTNYVGTTVVTVTPKGGSGVYNTFLWRAAFSGSNTGIMQGPQGLGGDSVYTMTPLRTTQASTIFQIRFNTDGGFIPIPSPPATGLFVCEITDSLGNKKITDVITVSMFFQ
jgi:hypothetical protein